MKSVQLDSVHTRQFLIKCNSFSQLNDMTNCPHPFATLGDCEQVLPPSVVAAHPRRCVYLWPCQSILVPRRVCLDGNVKVGTEGRSVCWSVNCIRPSEIVDRGGAVALSFRLEIPHLERHDMRCHFKILWRHIFSSHHTWLLCMGSLHRWFARLVSSISSSPSRILWPPSLFEWSLFKSFVLGLVSYTISC